MGDLSAFHHGHWSQQRDSIYNSSENLKTIQYNIFIGICDDKISNTTAACGEFEGLFYNFMLECKQSQKFIKCIKIYLTYILYII